MWVDLNWSALHGREQSVSRLPQLLYGNELPVLVRYTEVGMGPRKGLDAVITKKIAFFLPRIELQFQLAA
jgi:hypothetical protein